MKVEQSRIDKGMWWDEGVTLVGGCTPVSAGCDNCWSASMASRFNKHLVDSKGRWTGQVEIREDRLDRFKVKKPTTFAIWNDLFHPDVPPEFIAKYFEQIYTNPQHIHLVLTKRPENIKGKVYAKGVNNAWRYCDNLYLGVTAENRDTLKRLSYLRKDVYPVAKRFISFEPLLEEVVIGSLCLYGYDWIIIGAESGANHRLCDLEWVRNIVDECKRYYIPVFIKQLNINGRVVKDIRQFPPDLQLRELP